jgi:hypothetical protein
VLVVVLVVVPVVMVAANGAGGDDATSPPRSTSPSLYESISSIRISRRVLSGQCSSQKPDDGDCVHLAYIAHAFF